MQKTLLTVAVVLAALGCNEQRNKSIELMNSGVEKYKNRLFDSAERDMQAAIQVDPTNVLAHYNLGKVLEEEKKWNDAASEFEKAIVGDANNGNYHYDLGHACQEAGKLDQAEKELQEAVRIDPKLYKAYYRLGVVYEAKEKLKDADDMYRKSIGINQRFPLAFIALGFLYLNNDYLKESEQVFQNATAFNDGDGESWYGLGLARKELNNYDGAVEAFKKAVERGAKSPDLKYNLALAYHSKGDDVSAKSLLDDFIKSGRGDSELLKAANDLRYSIP
jgi:superkiller protein 3